MKTVPLALAALVLALSSIAPHAGAASYSAEFVDPAGGWMTSIESGAPSPLASTAPWPVTAGGMRVFIDPQTRKLRRPDAADIEKLNALSPPSRSRMVPTVRAMPNGGLAAVLDESFASNLIATLQSDGTIR